MDQITKIKIVAVTGLAVNLAISAWLMRKTTDDAIRIVEDSRKRYSDLIEAIIKNVPVEYLEGISTDARFRALVRELSETE